MNRLEFMRQLDILLTSITASEKAEALQYYNDYFDDAGAENEAEVIMALGTPARVAETIKAGLSDKSQEDWEFTETGFKNGANKNREIVIRNEDQNQSQSQNQQNNNYQNNYNPNGYGQNGSQGQIPPKRDRDTGKIILIVIVAILLCPLWISLAGAVFGVVVAVLATLAALLFAFGAVAIALLIAGIAIFAASFVKIFIAPLLGVLMMGTGLILVGVGILFAIGTIWICATVLPACVRGVVKLCRMPFEKRGGQYA